MTLSGVCADDVSVQSVIVLVTVDSIQVASLKATITGGTWSVSMDTSALSGGKEVQADLDIRATDGTGKTADKKVVVYLDNVSPVITSMSPTAATLSTYNVLAFPPYYALTDRETITGSVKDGLGLAQTEMDVGSVAFKDTTHPAAWSVVIDTTQFYDAAQFSVGPNYGARNGSTSIIPGLLYSVPFSVVATDLAGNLSAPISGTLYINPNGSPIVDISDQTPAINMSVPLYPNSPLPFLPDHIDQWQANSLSPGSTIKFRIFDIDGIDTSASGLYVLLIPASKFDQVKAGTLSPTPYTYTVGGSSGNALTEADIMKIQPIGGGNAIPQEADFTLVLPAGINGTTMPALGEYAVLIHVGDDASNKISGLSAVSVVPAPDSGGARYLSLYITQGPPTVKITSPANGAFLNAFSVSGEINDNLGSASVSVMIYDSSQALVAQGDINVPPPYPTHYVWSGYTIPGLPVMPDGPYSAAFVGKNIAAQVSSSPLTVQFNWDTTPPTASVQSVTPEGGLNTPPAFADTLVGPAPGGIVDVVNGVTRFKGTAADSAALASSAYSILHVTSTSTVPWTVDPTPVVASTAFAASTMSLWSLDIDTTNTARYNDGDYYVLSVTATDQAGNTCAPAQRTFQVKQSTDLPTVSLQNMDITAATSAQAKNNLLNTKIELDATVADDDRVDPNGIRILIDPKDAGGNPSMSYTSVFAADNVHGSLNTATGSVSFSYSLQTTSAGAVPEGRNWFYLVASDDASWKSGKPVATATIGPVWFAVDTHQPQISFDQSGGLYVSSNQALTGTVFSGNALDATAPLMITPDGGSTSYPTLSPDASNAGATHAWSYTLSVGGYSDGSQPQVTAVAKDEFGLSATSTFKVTVDKSPPLIATTNPAQFFSDVNGYSFVGTVVDQYSGVSSMIATTKDSGSNDVSSKAAFTWNAAAGSPATMGNWSLDLSSTLLATGTYTVQFTAIDRAGNQADLGPVTINVDKDLPVVAMSAPLVDGALFNAAFAAPANWTGTSTDAFLQSVSVKLDGGTPLSAGTSGTWSFPTNWASLPEGQHTLTVTAIDKGGHVTTKSVIFTKDITPPTLTVNAPTVASWLSGTSTTVRGSADDGSGTGVSKVYFIIDVASTDHSGDDPTTWTQANGTVSWTSNSINLASLGEGNKKLWVKSVDNAGNWNASATTVAFGVDLNPPNLVVAAPPATINATGAASFAGLTGTVYDTNPAGLPSLTVSSTLNGTMITNAAPVAYPGISITSGNAWSWNPFPSGIDTAGHTDDGLWTFTFIATDVAGKTSSITRNLTIDTQAPVTTITSPSAAWVSSGTLPIAGVATDGAGTGVSKVYAKVDAIYVASTGTDHSTEDPTVASGWTLTTGQTGWSGSLTLSGEGRKTLWVKSFDVAGNLTTAAGALSSRFDFGLDFSPPNVVFTDFTPNLVNAGFTLSGTLFDTNPAGLPALTVSSTQNGTQVSNAVSVPYPGTSTSVGNPWSWNPFPSGMDISGHTDDGLWTFTFYATDVAGKTSTISRTITIDTTPPVASISQPGNYTAAQAQYWLSGATTTMNGSASDPGATASGVATIYFLVAPLGANHASDSASAIVSGWGLAAGATNWSTTANLTTEGQFTLWTAAFDNAGNLSSISSRNYGVDQAPPGLTETNHPAVAYTKAAYSLAGDVGDSNALATLTITESKNGGPAGAATFASVPASLAGVKSATYSSASLPFGVGSIDTVGHSNDGSYAYVLVATDVAGKTSTVNRVVNLDTTPPVVTLNVVPGWISASAYTIAGTAADPSTGASGIAAIQYQLDTGSWTNATWIDTSGGANITGNWNATLTGLSEGNHSLLIRATDAAGNQTTPSATTFGVDLNPPSVTETFLNTTSQVTKNNGFVMAGTVTDTNPASIAGSTLTVAVSVNGGATSAAAIVGSTWTFTQPKLDGSYSYIITATDASGKTASVNRLVLLDSTPPTLSVISPTAGNWTSSSTLPISGTASDGSGAGVNKTYYLVDIAANDHSGDVASWNATSGGAAPISGTSATWSTATGLPSSWTGSSNLSGEGSKLLWVVSADKAGNTTTLASVAAGAFGVGSTYTIATLGTTDFTAIGASSNTVGISFVATGAGTGSGSAWSGNSVVVPIGLDLSPPSLSETGIGSASTVVRNSSILFTGAASDTNALAAAHSLTVSVDGLAALDVNFSVAPSWSFSYSVNTTTHAQDGTHVFVFTATDLAGKVTTVARSVLVDTIPGVSSITSPAASAWTNMTPFTAQGTASDGSGSGVYQVWTLADIASNSHAADSPATIVTGGAWKLATGTTDWTASWALGAEGTKILWVAVQDNAGNWSATYSTVGFGYDTTAPALTVAPLAGYRTTFAITGTTSDGASGVASIQLKIDAGTFSPVTVAASWSSTVTPATFAALSEGAHTVSVIATDVAGNQTTQAALFTKDTTPPALNYNNISSGGGTVDQDSNPILSGSLTDGSGVASASYALQVWNYSTLVWNTITAGTTLGSPAGATNYGWSLDLSATGLNLPDGKYQIAISASDIPGNSIVAPTSVTFLLSRTSPGASVAAPALGTFQDTVFTVVGTVSDPNGITLVRAKIASGSVDFSSGTTSALPALPVTVAVGSPGVFTSNSPHGLVVGDQVSIWGTPMPVTPAGALQSGTVYFVQSATATTFTIAATSGGAALAVTTSTATNCIVAASKYSFPTFRPAVPVSVSGNTLTANNHQLANGDVVYFQGTTLPSATNAATPYYVVNTAASTFQVSTTSGGSVLALGTPGVAVSVYSPTHSVSWMIPAMAVNGFSDGPLTAYVQAASGAGKTNQTSRDFTLDTTKPTIAIASPASTTRSVGNLSIVGTSSDGGPYPSGVTGSIQYQIGLNANLGNPASWTNANVSGGAYSWSISLGAMSPYANATSATQCDAAGNPSSSYNLWKLPIYFQAVDNAGNVQQKTDYWLILDPDGNIPVVTLTQPTQNGLTYGGQQRITGTASQPVWVHDIEVAVDPAGGSNFPANPVSASISASTLNSTGHPFTNGMTVYFAGTAMPQIGGISVSGTTPYFVVNAAANSYQVSTTSGGGPVTFSSSGTAVTASVWAPGTLITTGNSVMWYYDINQGSYLPQNGATNQTVTIQVRAWNSATAGGPRGTISGTLASPLYMKFDSTFPKIQGLEISPTNNYADPNEKSYFSQITVAGSFFAMGYVVSSKGIAKIEKVEDNVGSGSTILYNTSVTYGITNTVITDGTAHVTPPAIVSAGSFPNGGSYQLIITNLGTTTNWNSLGFIGTPTVGAVFKPNSAGTGDGQGIPSDSSGNFNYLVSVPINSANIYSGTSGVYAFDFRATDMTTPAQVSSQTVTLNEDNYYPTSSITSSSSIVGSQFVAQGSATDSGSGSGPISGFSKVVIYFVRGGSVLNLSTGANGATTTMVAKDMNNSGNVGPVTYPAAGANLKLSIDSLAENNALPTGGGSDVNGDGFMESLTINGSSYTWMGQIDSTKLTDGPVELHAVVFDTAGNATHYVQSAFVSNNAPVVNNVVIGTDITGGGTINSTATFSSGYATTGFIAVNKRLYFQLNTLKGNGALSYSLKNNGNQYWGTTGTTVSGNTITINFTSISPSIPDATGNSALFVLTVTDSTPGIPQSASVTIGMNIQNTDVQLPVVTVNPLYWTDASHNSIYLGSAANGHVDLGSLRTAAYNPYSATSPYSLPAGLSDADPKISGAISLTGTVSDNQRIGKLTIQIGNGTTGYDFGGGVGVAFDVATWNGSNLVGTDQWAARGWRLTVSNEVLTNTGHSATWQLDWNSAKLNTVAGTNVSISVKASDASLNVATPVASQVDVVPYISSLATKITTLLSSDFARTSSGQYPLQYNSTTLPNSESFVVNGFNLNPTNLTAGAASDIRLSKLYPSGYNNNATPAKAGLGLAGSGVNATFTQVTTNIQQASLGNGYLTVITNGVPSINNVNDSSQAYNTETSATVATMTDARYLSLWDITLLRSLKQYATGASFVSMAMNANTPQFAYSNNTYGYGINFFYDGATEQEIYENWNFMTYSALALNTNGSRAALYDVNVASAGVNFYSDWGGIMVNFFNNPPASAWNTSATWYRAYNLWLDDLHIPGNLATLDRFQFPDLAMIGPDTNSTVFYSTYDQINDQVLFRTFNVGTTVAAGANNAKGALANNLYTNLSQLNEAGTWPLFTNVGANNGRFSGGGGGIGTNNNSGNTPGAQIITTGAGPYTAVAATSLGSALLVYYRTASNQLVYSYNDTPTNNATWSAPTALATLVGGNYVRMKVDSANHVHIAYYDSFNGAVKYIYMPTYNAPATNTQVTVDNYLTVGDKMSLSVDANGKPYISYKGVGNTAKVAWLVGGMGTLADGVNASKLLTGIWEVEVIPNAIVDSDSNRFQIGVGSTTLRPVIGYTNNNTGAKGIEYLTRTADLTQ